MVDSNYLFTDIEPGLPEGFDYLGLGSLLNCIEELLAFSREGSMHALEGENETCERARRLIAAYRPIH